MRVSFVGVALLLLSSCKNDAPPAPAAPVAPVAPIGSTSSSSAAVPTAPPPPSAHAAPPPASTTCTTDSDCVLTTFPGCCSCCPCGPLKATTNSVDRAQRAACAATSCLACDGRDYKCEPCKDPTKEGMHARCRDGACILVETSAAAAAEPTVACKTDDDCWMDDKNKPIKRPANLRGKKIEPCKGGHEHKPACGKEGVCVVHAYKC